MMEFELIKRIRRRFPEFLGDDCAVVQSDCDEKLLLTTDELVENVHFSRRYFSLSDLGYKAVSSACSDVAAMGGKAIGILTSLSLPNGFSKREITQLYDGIQTFCQPLNIKLLGGNITKSDCGIHIVTSVLGIASNPVFRCGAKPGDIIIVTGALGGSLSGFFMLSQGLGSEISPLKRDLLAIRHRKPRCRIEAGRLLASYRISAMIDISDGLFSDLCHIATESNVGFFVALERLPLFPGVKEIARIKKIHPAILAARSGEEFELVFTAEPNIATQAAKALKDEFDVPTTVIGKVNKRGKIVTLNKRRIGAEELAGWKHLI